MKKLEWVFAFHASVRRGEQNGVIIAGVPFLLSPIPSPFFHPPSFISYPPPPPPSTRSKFQRELKWGHSKQERLFEVRLKCLEDEHSASVLWTGGGGLAMTRVRRSWGKLTALWDVRKNGGNIYNARNYGISIVIKIFLLYFRYWG